MMIWKSKLHPFPLNSINGLQWCKCKTPYCIVEVKCLCCTLFQKLDQKYNWKTKSGLSFPDKKSCGQVQDKFGWSHYILKSPLSPSRSPISREEAGKFFFVVQSALSLLRLTTLAVVSNIIPTYLSFYIFYPFFIFLAVT